MPPSPMGAVISYTPRRVPGVRAKVCVIIRAEHERGSDYSPYTPKCLEMRMRVASHRS